jgi:hypothetical protein
MVNGLNGYGLGGTFMGQGAYGAGQRNPLGGINPEWAKILGQSPDAYQPQAAFPKTNPREMTPIAPMPQAGWTPPNPQGAAGGGGAPAGGFDAIVNGSAPQLIPPQAQPRMPSPQAPQQNFNAQAQAQMAQLLQQQGGGM